MNNTLILRLKTAPELLVMSLHYETMYEAAESLRKAKKTITTDILHREMLLALTYGNTAERETDAEAAPTPEPTPTPEPPPEPEPTPTPEPAFTLDQVRRAAISLIDLGMNDLLGELLDGQGAKCVSDLTPEGYKAFILSARTLGARV